MQGDAFEICHYWYMIKGGSKLQTEANIAKTKNLCKDLNNLRWKEVQYAHINLLIRKI